ncbi:hypothetical protein ACIQRK_26835 [Streptomyces anulatus]
MVDEYAVRSTAFETAQALVDKAGDALGTIKARMCAPAEGKVLDEQGKLIAHATTTCVILQKSRPKYRTGGTRSLSLTVYVSRG